MMATPQFILTGQTLCEHPDIGEKFSELFG